LIPSAPSMSVPAGRRPPDAVFNSVTRSDSSRRTWNTRESRPMARILFLIARRLNSVESGSRLESGGDDGPEANELGVSSSSSSFEQVFRIAMSISVTSSSQYERRQALDECNVLFSPTNGKDHVKTSIKFGNQYGCGVQSIMVSQGEFHRLRRPTELSDVHHVVLVLQYGCLVVVHIKVVWCAEDGHHARKTSRPSLPVHAISGILRFVRANNRE
jgi:hypothetical protein